MRESPDCDLDAGQCDESGKDLRKGFIILGETAVAAKPGEDSLDSQRRGNTAKPFEPPPRLTISRRNAGTLAAAVLVCQALQPLSARRVRARGSDCGSYRRRGPPATILDTRGVNGGRIGSPSGIGGRMDFGGP
jgi:hypothetical protein